MTVIVKLFGPQAQIAGQREVALEMSVCEVSCAELRQALHRANPRLAPSLAASRFAVNHAYALDSDPVRPGDEVALIGLISGG